MSVTIKDVAERAGVSIATVSYVLTGTKKVKDSTREKVNKAIRELNYAPNLLAKGLKDKKSNLVGFITPNLSSPYYMSVIKMCEEQLKTQGYHMLVLSLDLQETDDTSAIRMLCNGIVGGLIWLVSPDVVPKIPDIVPSGIPMIIVGANEALPFADTIAINMEHSLSHLFRSVKEQAQPLLILTNPNYLYNEDEQYRMIGTALEEVDFPTGQVSYVNAGNAAEKLPALIQDGTPITVCAFGSDAIWDVFQDKTTGELKIPDNLDVFYLGDTQFDHHLTTRCTRLRVPLASLAQYTANLLVDGLQNPDHDTQALTIDSTPTQP